jgi:hypothetical protein
MRGLVACIVVLALVLAGCSRTGERQSKAAVQAAIEAHLQQRQNLLLANMTLEVQDVKFAGDTAQAEVKFRSKQSPDLAVDVHYTLHRAGERWQVESSSATTGMGMSPHGGRVESPASPVPSGSELKSSH